MSDGKLICGICCTYGRTDYLREMLHAFLEQDYQNRLLIIFNTCDAQRLQFEHPLVRIVNAPRPETMGETRNAAIEHAPEDCVLVNLDDDDIVLPCHLSNFMRGFTSDHCWSHLEKQFYFEGANIRAIVGGTPNVFGFTKEVWRKVGGYHAINCGEDRDFVGRVTAQCPGIREPMSNQQVSYIYRWGLGADAYHLSGKGDDKPGQMRGFDRTRIALQERLDAGREPKGDIVLKPSWRLDYNAMARKFVGGVKRIGTTKRGKIGICCLGHAGDILNILPAVKHIHDQGVKPMFFTSKAYGDVLDGVSYVDAVKLDLPDKDILKAVAEAEKRCEYVLTTQIHGEGLKLDRLCDSYSEEAWRLIGLLPQHQSDLRLVLDKRDTQREQELLNTYTCEGKMLVYHLTGGLSSPFSDGPRLGQLAREAWNGCCIDLAPIRAQKIYDMLVFLERASVLLTSDTYTLHLANACDIPVIAILNDTDKPFGRQWLRTKPRCNTILELGYSEALAQWPKIYNVMEGLLK